MIKINTFILLGLVSTLCYSQKGKTKIEIARDSFGFIAFDSMSLTPSELGIQELGTLSNWLIETNQKDYTIIFYSTLTSIELSSDQFFGVKRSKILADTLIKMGATHESNIIIASDITGNQSGVRFIIDERRASGTRKKKQLSILTFAQDSYDLSTDHRNEITKIKNLLTDKENKSKFNIYIDGIVIDKSNDTKDFLDLKRCKTIANEFQILQSSQILFRYRQKNNSSVKNTIDINIEICESKRSKNDDPYFKSK